MDIEEIKGYIDRNAAKIGTVAEIAAKFDVSADALRKTFKRIFGTPLSEYIIVIKVSQAKRLLEKTDMYCFEILWKVGFKREDSGLRSFKRRVGMTMIQYRADSRRKGTKPKSFPIVMAFCTK